jgi:hypothetical protein
MSHSGLSWAKSFLSSGHFPICKMGELYCLQNLFHLVLVVSCWWLMPIIQATWEAEEHCGSRPAWAKISRDTISMRCLTSQ